MPGAILPPAQVGPYELVINNDAIKYKTYPSVSSSMEIVAPRVPLKVVPMGELKKNFRFNQRLTLNSRLEVDL